MSFEKPKSFGKTTNEKRGFGPPEAGKSASPENVAQLQLAVLSVKSTPHLEEAFKNMFTTLCEVHRGGKHPRNEPDLQKAYERVMATIKEIDPNAPNFSYQTISTFVTNKFGPLDA